jgi:hypothetical protein
MVRAIRLTGSDVFNVLQTSPNNRSCRSRRISSTRAIGNKALSKVCCTFYLALRVLNYSFPVQRRNKWICALKTSLKECKIYGPSGNPAAASPPSEVTLVPWEDVKASKSLAPSDTDVTLQDREPRIPRGEYQFADRNQIVLDQGQDVWGETREVNMTAPKQTARPQLRGGQQTAQGAFPTHTGQHGGQGAPSTGTVEMAIMHRL